MKKKALSLLITYLVSNVSISAEHKVRGLIDTRVSQVDGLNTHVNGNYGKYRFDHGTSLTLSQAVINYHLDFDAPLSINVVAIGYLDGIDDSIGISEASLKYQGIPSSSGVRFSSRAGFIYPKISFENNATGWTSPYTLTYSTINNWIGEELKHTGLEFTLDFLGKFRQSKHNLSLTTSVYKNNDTTGTLLSWRGWTQSSRQTLWHERLPVPPVKARFGGWLKHQAAETDPFIELDHRYGFEGSIEWQWNNQVKLRLGHYDNNADTKVFKNGQYVWETTFSHAGLHYKLTPKTTFISQFLTGDTLMTSPWGMPVVDNDFQSGFALLTHKHKSHRYTARIEEFSVTDNDLTPDDDNNEYGKSITLSYQYRFNRNIFLQAEYNWLNSDRPARAYSNQDISLTEQQYQLAAKYYW
ncbi:hypothetical protein [Thalassomonas sp. M1454]|uniref:hypothetical protein n=1 Tax=Thalassomonas sp. M1454 TaxID=2594477 RepID=UPI001180A973|nr:hypothetical protein [Thalassomonas sp. M1454]TRX57440.1 hypothetical protein FNN08_08070 [Thalassomonas sp. M1454]